MFRSRSRRLAIIVVFLGLVAAFSGGIWWVAFNNALDQVADRGRADLELASDRLTGELQRFRTVAVLMSDHPDVLPLVLHGEPIGAAPLLLEVAAKTGSLDVIVIDVSGRELANASGLPAENHAGRAYFERAMDGALGVDHVLSDRYDRRSFTFASPVFSTAGPVAGVVAVVADVAVVESVWRGDRAAIYFIDQSGVVFVSNRSELLFRNRGPASSSSAMPFVSFKSEQVDEHELWRVDGGRYLPSRALHLGLDLPVIGLRAEAILDIAPAQQLAFLQAAVAAALCLAFGAFLFLATERRRTLAEANLRLEARVVARTADLETVNADLRREVTERTEAEKRLHQAQADLVQAGKLSALGQMSAGISHELNQPLMAIRSFAENAEAYLEQGNQDVAAKNLSRISDLARRMGRIIRNLRSFARQESEAPTDVDIVEVVDSALEMAAARLRNDQVEVAWVRPEAPILVRGGEVRLQQVVLNLVTNGADAMEAALAKRLELSVRMSTDRVELSVRDHGPGIAEPKKIFDPFYSTKKVGSAEGMGLGLSISYGLVQSFGGQIKGRNHPESGAIFTVELDRVKKESIE